MDRECADDYRLREELLSLLEEGFGAEAPLEDPASAEPTGEGVADRLLHALGGRYRIQGLIGTGGMAEVYRAVDDRHDRLVALKVLRPELAVAVGSERFLAEIKTTANLQHPHILPLYDSGEADGLLYYVMPFVEGESLRQRLDREGQLPVDDAVRIASGVAEGLDFAHRQAVVHRDIKPGNVLLLDGRPVVADFGIARALGAAGGGRLTQTGLALGTPHYMSPEQAVGEAQVGPPTDIWALGCLLHEMLVGEPPFTGSTPTAILGKILTSEPPSASTIRPTVPSNVDAVIRRSLERVPADRFVRGRDLIEALQDRGFRQPDVHDDGEGPPARPSGRLLGTLAASTILLALLSGWLILDRSGPTPPPTPERFEFPAPGAVDLESGGVSVGEPGVVFVGPAGPDRRQLWLRRWEDLELSPIPGTDGESVATPSLSPDGTEIAFVADSELKVVPVSGGAVRTLADAAGCCPRWSGDEFLYFSKIGSGIRRIRPGSPGSPVDTVTRLGDGEADHADMLVLPGGKAALFTVRTGIMDGPRIEAFDFATGGRTVLVDGASPRVTSTGHLVYGNGAGQILAVPFDSDGPNLTGPPDLVAEGVYDPPGVTATAFDVGPSGRLVYLAAAGGRSGTAEFVWLDRTGGLTPLDPDLVLRPDGVGWAFAPDGSKVAFNNTANENNDIYVKHLPNGPVDRITTDPAVDQRPFWTPDGERLLYFTQRGNPLDRSDLTSVELDGLGPESILTSPEIFAEGSSSPGTEWLALRSANLPERGIRPGIWALRLGRDSVPVRLVSDEGFSEGLPAVSPDGRWLTYLSDRTGEQEVYVRPFPGIGEGPGVRVSRQGGLISRWAPSGRELLFLRPDGVMVSTDFDPATGTVSGARELFTLPDGWTGWARIFEVAPDGRLLMMRPRAGGAPSTPRFVVVRNFESDLGQRDRR